MSAIMPLVQFAVVTFIFFRIARAMGKASVASRKSAQRPSGKQPDKPSVKPSGKQPTKVRTADAPMRARSGKPARARHELDDGGSDWLAEQIRSERESQRRLYRSEGRELRDEHAASCGAMELRSFHEAGCDADAVGSETRARMSREDMEARKAELRRKLNR